MPNQNSCRIFPTSWISTPFVNVLWCIANVLSVPLALPSPLIIPTPVVAPQVTGVPQVLEERSAIMWKMLERISPSEDGAVELRAGMMRAGRMVAWLSSDGMGEDNNIIWDWDGNNDE